VNYYNLGIYNFSNQAGQLAVHTELWSDNPCSIGAQPIAGSGEDFVLEHDGTPAANLLEIPLGSTVDVPATVWLAVTFTGGLASEGAWILAGQAEIGSTQNLFVENNTGSPGGCLTYGFAGGNPYSGFWANVVCRESIPDPVGACCEELSGACIDEVLEADCLGPTERWSVAQTCAEVACSAATGACCNGDPFDGCRDAQTIAQCCCMGCEWTRSADCTQVECPHEAIPAVSFWGLGVLSLLLLIGAKLRFGISRPTSFV
jgi:hypothetical protein